MNTEPTQYDAKQTVNDEVIQTTAERLIAQEVLACQSGLIDTLLRPGEIEGFTIDEIQNVYIDLEDGDTEVQEIFEWWLVTPWLAEKLVAINQPVLDNGLGHWWGRTCTGQAIALDGTMQEIARLIHRAD